MNNKKKQYNKLRAYLAVFGISYSHYIRECDGVLPLNPEVIKDAAVYSDIIHKMCNSYEGFMYWYFLRLVWTEFLSNNIPMSAMNIRNRVLVTVLRESLLKQLGNGAFGPKKLKREKVKEVLLSFRRNLQGTARSECTESRLTTFDYV